MSCAETAVEVGDGPVRGRYCVDKKRMEGKRTLEKAQWFCELLSGNDEPPLLTRFRRFGISSALDIGCGDGMAHLHMYYALGTDHLEGVESRTKAMVLDDLRTRARNGRTSLSCLEDAWLGMTSSTYDLRPLVQDKVQVSSVMSKVRYNRCAEYYKPSLEAYDSVILSHLLHCVSRDQARTFLKMANEYAKPNGLVFISIKDGYSKLHSASEVIDGAELLALCEKFVQEHAARGLRHVAGSLTESEG